MNANWLPIIAFPCLFAWTIWRWKVQNETKSQWREAMGLMQNHQIKYDDRNESRTYYCQLSYAYQINGREYYGHRLYWNDGPA